MAPESARRAAFWLALLIPAALLGGAYLSQYGFGLFPCEMCWWQRYSHFAAIALALGALATQKSALGDVLVRLAALAILVSGLIGLFHAGVEYKWWEGLTACTSSVVYGNDPLAAILAAPVIRCDTAQWTLFGVSLAGFNFLFSTGGALLIFALLGQAKRKAA